MKAREKPLAGLFLFGAQKGRTPMKTGATTQRREDFIIEQDWPAYSAEEHQVWQLLYERRMKQLRSVASRAYLDGADAIGLDPGLVPDLREINARLEASTGWAAIAVSGFIPASDFFGFLAERRFPTTISVRQRSRLDYVPEPDIFHDVFGHVPLHSIGIFADFLQRFGKIAAAAASAQEVEKMARLFWFTVEFGLIREEGETRVYGSGLISSQADCLHALGPDCERREFSLEAAIAQPFRIDQLQPVLFVIESFEQLFEAVIARGGV